MVVSLYQERERRNEIMFGLILTSLPKFATQFDEKRDAQTVSDVVGVFAPLVPVTGSRVIGYENGYVVEVYREDHTVSYVRHRTDG